MAKNFDKVKDSGARREFNTGARRDMSSGKGRFDLLPVHAIMKMEQLNMEIIIGEKGFL